jgi:hypothetical protein
MPPLIDATVSFFGEPERRHALTRLADWLNDLAVQLFDLAGRIRGGAR